MYRIVFLIIKEFAYKLFAHTVLQNNEFLLRELRIPAELFALSEIPAEFLIKKKYHVSHVTSRGKSASANSPLSIIRYCIPPAVTSQ